MPQILTSDDKYSKLQHIAWIFPNFRVISLRRHEHQISTKNSQESQQRLQFAKFSAKTRSLRS
jgi:hypothetical protein